MANLLEQWQEAEKQGNWALLNHYLQQALLSDRLENLLPEIGIDRLLNLAIAVLEEGDFHDRWEIAKVLPALGEAAVPTLVRLLQDEDVDSETRWFVARILGELKSSATTDALITLLHTSTDAELNLMAAEALAKMGNGAIASLTDLLSDPATRLPAVRALTQIRSSEILDPLLQVANDPHPEIRSLVIEALGHFPDPRVLQVLLNGLTDPAPIVKQAAIAGLSANPEAANTDLVKQLGKCLYDLNLEVCQQAAISLGRIGNLEALTQLFRVLTSSLTPPSLQTECIRAIAWTGSAESLHCLQRIFASEYSFEQSLYRETVIALGRWSNPELKPEAAQILMDLLATHHPAIHFLELKQALSLALGYLGQSAAIAPLSQLLAEDNANLRLHTIAALKTLDAPASHHYLKQLAHQPDLPEELHRGITIALQEWGNGVDGEMRES